MNSSPKLRSLTAVIPMRNEVKNVETFMGRLCPAMWNNADSWRLIVPLTGNDGTRDLLKWWRMAEIIDRPPGLGAAYRDGLAHALKYGSPILTMDADLSHLPEQIEILVFVYSLGHDLVIGSKHNMQAPLSRRVSSKISNFLLGGPISDYTNAFRIYSPELLRTVLPEIQSEGYGFFPEIVFRALRHGFDVVEVPTEFPARNGGKSNMSYTENLLDYAKLFYWRYLGKA